MLERTLDTEKDAKTLDRMLTAGTKASCSLCTLDRSLDAAEDAVENASS